MLPGVLGLKIILFESSIFVCFLPAPVKTKCSEIIVQQLITTDNYYTAKNPINISYIQIIFTINITNRAKPSLIHCPLTSKCLWYLFFSCIFKECLLKVYTFITFLCVCFSFLYCVMGCYSFLSSWCLVI